MKLKHIVLVPLVAAIAGYVGLKGYIYFKVKSDLDRAVAASAAFADISYGWIDSSFRGAVSVEDVRIVPVGTGAEIRIDSVAVKGPGPAFLLDILSGFDPNDPPKTMEFSIRGGRVPVGVDFASGLGAGPAGAVPEPCTLAGILGHVGADDIGYRQFITHGRVSYNLDRYRGEFGLEFDYSIDTVESVSAEVVFAGIPELGAVAVGVTPNLKHFDLRYRVQPGYIEPMVERCAGLAGQAPEAFVASLFEGPDEHFADSFGFIPGPGMRHALRQLITDPGEVLLSARPRTELNPAQLAMSHPEDIIRMLGLRLSVNGQTVGDLSFALPEPYDGRVAGSGTPVVEQGFGGEPSISPMPEPRRRILRAKPQFVATPVGTLRNLTGRVVRLYGDDPRAIREGRLKGLENGILHVERRLQGGAVTYHVPIEGVTRAEVLQRR